MSNQIEQLTKALGFGKLPEAEEMCRRKLVQEPQNARALHLAGLIALSKGNCAEAAELMAKSVSIWPDASEFHNNLGTALGKLGRIKEAIEALQRAVHLDPTSYDVTMNLTHTLGVAERFAEAEGMARRAIALRPQSAQAHVALAAMLQGQERLEEAVTAYSAALNLKPARTSEIFNSLGLIMERLGRTVQAVEAHRRAAAAKPGTSWLDSNYLYALRYCTEQDNPEIVFREHAAWAKKWASPFYESLPPPMNDPSAERKLRIAYVSADFRGHSASTCMEPLIRHHDRENWEVWCYSDVGHPDAVTARFKSAADVWCDVHGMSDELLARKIRDDRIDVLIDHTGHMGGNRMMVFARRAAPVQVAFPGYPGTTGLEVMDAFITDVHQDPQGAERFYTERLVRFDGSPRCYRPPKEFPEPGPLPADRCHHVTFGIIQRPAKLNERMFSTWSRLLAAVPTAKFLLLLGTPRVAGMPKELMPLLRRLGFDEKRIEIVPRQRPDRYLRLFERIDVVLDTQPYAGCATTLDALWMGVPVVTMAGRTYVARVGTSVLSHLGLGELVAATEDEYVSIAANLAADIPRLRDLRQSLRKRMSESSVLDGRRVTSELENACRQLWREWCRKR